MSARGRRRDALGDEVGAHLGESARRVVDDASGGGGDEVGGTSAEARLDRCARLDRRARASLATPPSPRRKLSAPSFGGGGKGGADVIGDGGVVSRSVGRRASSDEKRLRLALDRCCRPHERRGAALTARTPRKRCSYSWTESSGSSDARARATCRRGPPTSRCIAGPAVALVPEQRLDLVIAVGVGWRRGRRGGRGGCGAGAGAGASARRRLGRKRFMIDDIVDARARLLAPLSAI